MGEIDTGKELGSFIDASIYAFHEDGELGVRVYDPDHVAEQDEIKEWVEKRILGDVELSIVRTLYKYAFLNRRNIEKALDLVLKPHLRKPKYVKNLRFLYEMGMIVKYAYQTKESDLTFFGITRGVYSYMKTHERMLQRTHRPIEDPHHVTMSYPMAQILERLSLNQAHINLLSSYKEKIKREAYFGKATIGHVKTYFPSVIKIRLKQKRILTVLTIPCPKDENGLHIFFKRLSSVSSSMIGEKSVILLIVCESIRQIERIFALIRSMKEYENLYPLYTIDLHTVYANGLEWLYMFRVSEENQVSLESFDIHADI